VIPKNQTIKSTNLKTKAFYTNPPYHKPILLHILFQRPYQ